MAALSGSTSSYIASALKKAASRKYSGFTLAELIVVVTILAILATIGFLALSGYSSDARDSALKANVRSVYSAIAAESALTNNSPRYYVIHDAAAALTGTFVYIDNTQTALTGGAWGAVGTNYSAGNPDYVKLKLNSDKFKVASFSASFSDASAAYDPTGQLSVGAMDYSSSVTITGRGRSSSYFQVAGIGPVTRTVVVLGDFPPTSVSGSVAGLVKDPSSVSTTGALVDAGVVGGLLSGSPSSYPGCDSADVVLSNGQIWAACNVGASNAWTGWVSISNCSASATDCDSTIRSTLGSYFQWGRNDDVTAQGTPTTIRASSGNAGHTDFITPSEIPYDWITTQNDNLWGGGSTAIGAGTFADRTAGDQAAMKGPCAFGYHVPTQAEWWSAINAIHPGLVNDSHWYDDTALATILKLPLAGDRNLTASYLNQGVQGAYWSSSPSGSSSWYFTLLSATQVLPVRNYLRAYGLPIRCLKN